jgi:hypothetical protein
MKITFTLIGILFTFISSAQRCATPAYSKLNPVSRIFNPNATVHPAVKRDTLNDEVITIPVVVHVLYNNAEQNISDQQIQSQIDVLNNDYRRRNADAVNTPIPFNLIAADTRISFCLAKVDSGGKYTTGIVRKFTKESSFLADDQMKFSSKGGDNAWDPTKYLNIWVCNLFGRTLGYAVLPGSPAEKDGVVMKYNVFGTIGTVTAPYNKGRTATHEIGHWLGLKHLWGDADCGDDGIADTPPQQTSNSFCPSFPHLSACSINPYGDMFMNFMDFTDDACMNMFTQGQKTAMRGLFAAGNFRNSFLTTFVCDSSKAEAGPVVTPPDTAATALITTYPNPFVSEINIASKNAGDLVGKSLRIFDITGKLILSQVIQSQKTTLLLDFLPAGLYLMKIEGSGNSNVYKLLKQTGKGR